jgi:hypothetical protein
MSAPGDVPIFSFCCAVRADSQILRFEFGLEREPGGDRQVSVLRDWA